MVDYVGHIDVKPFVAGRSHAALHLAQPALRRTTDQIKANERWQKIVGPFLFYCNGGESPQAMWQDALVRAAQEQKEWPYAWADVPGYEHSAQRGSVTGGLVIRDPQASGQRGA